jgi:hypothetical protein
MESPLVAVFLAVIALTALLQAGFVAALAFGLRMGNQKLSEFEEQFENGVVPRLREAAKLTDRAAGLAEKTLAQAERMDGVVANASQRAERYMDDAAAKRENVAARAALRVDSELAMREERVRGHRIVRRLSSASAFITGLQRALEVWQASAAAQAAAEDGDEEEEDDDDLDFDAGPSNPSPA